MILNVFMRRTGKWNKDFLFEIKNGDMIDYIAVKDAQPAKLLIDGNEFSFPSKIKKIKRRDFSYRYPVKKKDTKFGFQILRNNVIEGEYYREVALKKELYFPRKLHLTYLLLKTVCIRFLRQAPKMKHLIIIALKMHIQKKQLLLLKEWLQTQMISERKYILKTIDID